MKKVIKKLNKTLSVLLAAAMIVGSVPDVTLVAQAEEVTEENQGTDENGGTNDGTTPSDGTTSSGTDTGTTGGTDNTDSGDDVDTPSDGNTTEGGTQGGTDDGNGTDTTPQGGTDDGNGTDTTPQGGTDDGNGTDTTPQGGTDDGNGTDTTPQGGTDDANGSDTTPQGGTDDGNKPSTLSEDEEDGVGEEEIVSLGDTLKGITFALTGGYNNITVKYSKDASVSDWSTEGTAITADTESAILADGTNGITVYVKPATGYEVKDGSSVMTEAGWFATAGGDAYTKTFAANQFDSEDVAITLTVSAIQRSATAEATEGTEVGSYEVKESNGTDAIGTTKPTIESDYSFKVSVPAGKYYTISNVEVFVGDSETALTGDAISFTGTDNIGTYTVKKEVITGDIVIKVTTAATTLDIDITNVESGLSLVKSDGSTSLDTTADVNSNLTFKVTGTGNDDIKVYYAVAATAPASAGDWTAISDNSGYTITAATAFISGGAVKSGKLFIKAERNKYPVKFAFAGGTTTATGSTVTYSTNKDAATYKPFNLTSGESLPKETYYFKITTPKSIAEVEYDKPSAATSSTPVESAKQGTVYPVTVAAGQAGDLTVTVTTATADKTVTVKTDKVENEDVTGIKAVYYQVAASTPTPAYGGTGWIKVTNGKFNIPSDTDGTTKQVFVKVEYAEHYKEYKYAYNGATTLSNSSASQVYVVPVKDGQGAAITAPELRIQAQRIVNAYTFDVAANAVITINNENIKSATGKGTDGAAKTVNKNDYIYLGKTTEENNFKQVTVSVEDGKTLSFNVEATSGNKIASVKYNSNADVPYVTDSDSDFKYQITSSNDDTVVVSATANVAASITFANAVTTVKPETSVGADDAITATSQATTIEVLKFKADGTADTSDSATIDSPYTGAKEQDKNFQFKVNTADGYVVDKVTYSTASNSIKDKELTANDGVYAIDTIPVGDNITVTIKTKIDIENAMSVTFEWDNNIDVAITGIASSNAHEFEGAIDLKNGGTVLANAAISYTATPKAGYVIDVNGTKYTNDNPYTSGTVTFTKGASESVKLESSALAVADGHDRFVKIIEPNAQDDTTTVTLDAELVESKNVYNAASDTRTKYSIYKISSDSAAPELTITMNYGDKLGDITKSSASVIDSIVNIEKDKYSVSADKKTITYTGAILTAALKDTYNNTTQESEKTGCDELTISVATSAPTVEIYGAPESITVDGTSVSVGSYGPQTWNAISNAKLGSEIVVKIADYQKLSSLEKKTSTTAKDLSVDSYREYVFTVEGDTYLKVEDNVEASKFAVTVNQLKNEDSVDITSATGSIAVPHTVNTFKMPLTVETAELYVAHAAGSTDTRAVNVKSVSLSGGSKSTAAVDKTGNSNAGSVVLTLNPEDAGATLTLTINLELVTATGKKTSAQATATVILESVLSGVAVKDITNGDKITLDAAQTKTFDLSILSEAFMKEQLAKGTNINDLIKVETKLEKGTAKTTASVVNVTDATTGKVSYKLTVNAGTNEETAIVNILDKSKTKDNVLFSFTVEVAAPAVTLKSVASPAQGSNTVLLTLTPSNTEITSTGYVFYEVIANTVSDVKPTGTLQNKAFYIPVETTTADANGKVWAKAGTYELKLNTAKADAAAADYELTSRIVTLKASKSVTITPGTPLSAESVLGESSILSGSNAITTKLSTRNAYYEDNLSVKKIDYTVYNTDVNKAVATVKYSKNASVYGGITSSVYDATGAAATGFTVNVDPDGTVKVTAPNNNTRGKYTVVLEAQGTTDPKLPVIYKAKAEFKINVVQGITAIEDSRTRKVKLNTKKNTTYTFSPILVGGTDINGKPVNPKSKSLKYEINGVNALNKNNVSINEKTGKLTISKNFVVGSNAANNKFNVVIKATDCAKTTTTLTVRVEVTNENVVLGSVYLEKFNTTSAKFEKAADTLTVKDTNLRLKVLDASGNDASSFVTYKSSNSNIAINAKTGAITVKKPAKNVVFTVTTTDGSKKSIKTGKYTFNYAKADSLNIEFADVEGVSTSNYNKLVEKSQNYYEYIGTVNSKFRYEVYNYKTDDNGNVTKDALAAPSIYNYKLSVKGGKLVTDAALNKYVIPTAQTTVITITDNANKTKKAVTLFNTNWQTTKAPKAKLVSGKAYVLSTEDLTYAVKGDYPYAYITNDAEKYAALTSTNPVAIKDGQFKITVYGNAAGTDKYTIVYGDKDKNGTFVPLTKAANLNIKVNKMSNFKPQTSYVYNAKVSKYIEFTGKPANALQTITAVESANIGGQPNQFAKYFKLSGNKIEAQKELADAISKGTLKTEDLTGHVTYKYINGKGAVATASAKITVVINNEAGTYEVESANILNIKDSADTVGFTVNGKAAELISTVVKTETKDWTVTVVADKSGKFTQLKVTAGKAFEPGEYTVEAYVVPKDLYGATTITDAKKGTLVKIPVVVNNAAEYTGKVYAKAYIDLSVDGIVVKSNSIKKTTYWQAVVNANNLIVNEKQDVAKIQSAVQESGDIEVSYDKGTNNFTFNVYKNTVEAGAVYSVPVKLGFGSGIAEEVVTIDVVVPSEIQTLEDVAAAIEKYLTTELSYTTVNSNSDVDTKIDAAKIVDKIAGVTYAAKDFKKTTAGGTTTCTVTVVITDKYDSTLKAEVSAELPKDVVAVQKTPNDVKTAVLAQAALIVSDVDDATLALTSDQKDKAYQLSSSTTRFDIRAHLEQVIKNDDYMLSIRDYKITKATDKVDGKVEFKLYLVSKNGEVAVGDFVAGTPAKKGTPNNAIIIKKGN